MPIFDTKFGARKLVRPFFHTICSPLLALYRSTIYSKLLHNPFQISSNINNFLHTSSSPLFTLYLIFTTYSKLSPFKHFTTSHKKVRIQIVFLSSPYLIPPLVSFFTILHFTSLHHSYFVPFTSPSSFLPAGFVLPVRHILSAMFHPWSHTVSPIFPIPPFFSFHFSQLFFFQTILPGFTIFRVQNFTSRCSVRSVVPSFLNYHSRVIVSLVISLTNSCLSLLFFLFKIFHCSPPPIVYLFLCIYKYNSKDVV